MNVSVADVGKESQPCTVTITARQAMNFAAALQDDNPLYFDDTREAGIIAPPLLAVALTWPLSASFEQWWPGTKINPELRARQVHYEESLCWRRPMRPGDEVTIQGTIAGIHPHPAGATLTLCYTARGRDGEAVFTEWITGLLRDVGVTEAAGAGQAPQACVRPSEATPCWECALPIDPLAAHLYDGCTNIEFPIHTSAAFARRAGLPGPIYQGTATLGHAVRELINREGGADPGALYELHAGFRTMVFPGTTLLLRTWEAGVDSGLRTLYFDVLTPEGAPAIRNGRIRLRAAS
jgi:acyl dehydratase